MNASQADLPSRKFFVKSEEKAVPQPEIKHSYQGEIKLVLDWGTTSPPKEQMRVINLTKFQEKRTEQWQNQSTIV